MTATDERSTAITFDPVQAQTLRQKWNSIPITVIFTPFPGETQHFIVSFHYKDQVLYKESPWFSKPLQSDDKLSISVGVGAFRLKLLNRESMPLLSSLNERLLKLYSQTREILDPVKEMDLVQERMDRKPITLIKPGLSLKLKKENQTDWIEKKPFSWSSPMKPEEKNISSNSFSSPPAQKRRIVHDNDVFNLNDSPNNSILNYYGNNSSYVSTEKMKTLPYVNNTNQYKEYDSYNKNFQNYYSKPLYKTPYSGINISSPAPAYSNPFQVSPHVLQVDPGGLINYGNTCFMNSILQFMLSFNYFKDQLNVLNMDSFPSVIYCFMQALQSSAKERFDEPSIQKVRRSLPRLLQPCLSQFVKGHQQDAHECLVALFDLFEQTEKKILIKENEENRENENKENENENKENNQVVNQKPVQIIDQCFGFEMIHETKCSNCEWNQKRKENYRDLSLYFKEETEIKTDANVTVSTPLLEMIQNQFQSQQVEYRCEKCAASHAFVMQHAPLTGPPILLLHIARFATEIVSGRVQVKKRSDRVLLPYQMSLFQAEYRLCALVSHHGHAFHFGHYICHVFNENNITTFNDERVYRKTIFLSDHGFVPVLQQSCYLIAYERVS